MAYRYGSRYQMRLLPQSVEEYVAADHPIRAYDAFAEVLDFPALRMELDSHQVGNSEYDPKAMMKHSVYGYSYGVMSSRKQEQETHQKLAFIWLMGALKTDHKTIAEYRRKNKRALKKALKQCAGLCIHLDLIAGNALFVNGAKVRANSSRSKMHDRGYYEQQISGIGGRIEQLLEECEKVDQKEEGEGSWVATDKGLANESRLKGKTWEVREILRERGGETINLTNPDCAVMHSTQGSHASYNVQCAVDEKHGLIVHAEAVSETSDVNQFARQIEQAKEVLPEPCEVACADAGYADTEELGKIGRG